jgi:cell division protein FtsQ
MNKKVRNILRLTVLAIFAIFIAAGSIFVIVKTTEKQNILKINNVNITIHRNSDIVYLQQKDIENYLYNQHKISLIGQKINEVNTNYVETLLNRNPYIKHSEAYIALDGTIYLDIEQRNPVIKVYNIYGEIFNVDQNGIIMPNNPEYPAHIRIANGKITARHRNGDTAKNILHNVFLLSQHLSTDTVTDVLVEQLYVNEKNNIIIIPRIGNIPIIFGKITDMENKTKKIKDFYVAMPSFNADGKYSTLDARFKNQIVGILN